MATIYRFIVEQKQTGGRSGGSGRNTTNATTSGNKKKQTAKVGRWVSIFGGEKGGVEHNRKMRAINPLLNKATGGYWEKGMRLGRAGAGLIQRNTETGKLGISGPAIAIIIAFVLITLSKYNDRIVEANRVVNARNFTKLENGFGSIHGAYTISTNVLGEYRSYKQNK